MVAVFGKCVFASHGLEIYEEILAPGKVNPAYYWKALYKDKLHGPFYSIAQAHLHHDIFLKAMEAGDYQNVIWVDFKGKRRTI